MGRKLVIYKTGVKERKGLKEPDYLPKNFKWAVHELVKEKDESGKEKEYFVVTVLVNENEAVSIKKNREVVNEIDFL